MARGPSLAWKGTKSWLVNMGPLVEGFTGSPASALYPVLVSLCAFGFPSDHQRAKRDVFQPYLAITSRRHEIPSANYESPVLTVLTRSLP